MNMSEVESVATLPIQKSRSTRHTKHVNDTKIKWKNTILSINSNAFKIILSVALLPFYLLYE